MWYVVTVLSERASESETTVMPESNTTQQTLPGDDRIVLTPDNIEQHSQSSDGFPICDVAFVTKDGDETVTYNSGSDNFSVDVPYNSDWGTAEFSLNPVDELDDAIDDGTGGVTSTYQYGPMSVGEGCGWYRWDRISVREPRTFDEIEEAFKGQIPFAQLRPRETTVGPYDVVEYNFGGLCGQPSVEVLGKDHNFVFWRTCGFGELEDDQAELRSVVETLKLTDDQS